MCGVVGDEVLSIGGGGGGWWVVGVGQTWSSMSHIPPPISFVGAVGSGGSGGWLVMGVVVVVMVVVVDVC